MFLVSNLGCAARFSRRHQIVSNDLSAFISQAHRAMEQRFYHLEPSLHKNGKIFLNNLLVTEVKFVENVLIS